MIAKIVVTNQLFYWQKTLLVTLLVSLLFFIAAASFVFTAKVKELANKPLESLETEIILQKDRTDKAPQTVKTKGNILPFNLESFRAEPVISNIEQRKEIKAVSTALVFWQFDIANTITVIGLKLSDPAVGIRKIGSMLMPGGKFFESDSADEVILERHFSQLYGFKIGHMYRMNNAGYRIVGIVDFKEQSNLSNAEVFMPYETATKAVGIESGDVNQIYISLSKASSLELIKTRIAESFPDLSVITKDKLLANLSNLNRIFYGFGDYVATGISLIVVILGVWILAMYRLEYKNQAEIFRILGWPKRSSRKFIFIDLVSIVAYSGILAAAFTLVFVLLVVPGMRIESLLTQGFKL